MQDQAASPMRTEEESVGKSSNKTNIIFNCGKPLADLFVIVGLPDSCLECIFTLRDNLNLAQKFADGQQVTPQILDSYPQCNLQGNINFVYSKKKIK